MDLLVNTANAVTAVGFDLLVLAGSGHAAAEALAVGAAAGAVATLVFLWSAPRATLARALSELSTDLLEIWIYRRLPRAVLRAEWRLAGANARLLAAALPPLLASALVAAPLLVHSHYRFGLQVPAPGDDVLFAVLLDGDRFDLARDPATLTWVEGHGQVLGPVRSPEETQLTWRLRPASAGSLRLGLSLGTWSGQIPLQVGGDAATLAPQRWRDALPRLLSPRGEPLGPGSPALGTAVEYVSASGWWTAWWGLGSLVGALVAAAAVARLGPLRHI